MSVTSIETQTNKNYLDEKEKVTKAFLERLSHLGRAFWQYTEETGETNTKSYEGLL